MHIHSTRLQTIRNLASLDEVTLFLDAFTTINGVEKTIRPQKTILQYLGQTLYVPFANMSPHGPRNTNPEDLHYVLAEQILNSAVRMICKDTVDGMCVTYMSDPKHKGMIIDAKLTLEHKELMAGYIRDVQVIDPNTNQRTPLYDFKNKLPLTALARGVEDVEEVANSWSEKYGIQVDPNITRAAAMTALQIKKTPHQLKQRELQHNI